MPIPADQIQEHIRWRRRALAFGFIALVPFSLLLTYLGRWWAGQVSQSDHLFLRILQSGQYRGGLETLVIWLACAVFWAFFIMKKRWAKKRGAA